MTPTCCCHLTIPPPTLFLVCLLVMALAVVVGVELLGLRG